LTYIDENYTEPMVGYPDGYKCITIFGCSKTVFEFFCMGSGGGIEDDNIKPLVALNFKTPVSEGWFNDTLHNALNAMILLKKLKKHLTEHDITGYYTTKKEKDEHIEKVRSVFKLTDILHFRSKCYNQVHTWYLDHMASKAIPKFRKEKADIWSKDHLVIHLAGAYCSKDDTVHYSIYPELVSEQANTIISQID